MSHAMWPLPLSSHQVNKQLMIYFSDVVIYYFITILLGQKYYSNQIVKKCGGGREGGNPLAQQTNKLFTCNKFCFCHSPTFCNSLMETCDCKMIQRFIVVLRLLRMTQLRVTTIAWVQLFPPFIWTIVIFPVINFISKHVPTNLVF